RVEPVALEDDEPRVDAAPAQRLHVRPRDAGRVHRTVDDAQRAAAGSRSRGSHGPGRRAVAARRVALRRAGARGLRGKRARRSRARCARERAGGGRVTRERAGGGGAARDPVLRARVPSTGGRALRRVRPRGWPGGHRGEPAQNRHTRVRLAARRWLTPWVGGGWWVGNGRSPPRSLRALTRPTPAGRRNPAPSGPDGRGSGAAPAPRPTPRPARA